jgi:hypothetical protein
MVFGTYLKPDDYSQSKPTVLLFLAKEFVLILFNNFLCLTKYIGIKDSLTIDRPTSKTVRHSHSEHAQRCNSNEEIRRV